MVDWPPSDRFAELCRDQREQWRRGERVLVESYLDGDPKLRADEQLLLDFIYAEYCLREEIGEAASPDEYFERFPQFESRLRPQFELHQEIPFSASRFEPATDVDGIVVGERRRTDEPPAERPNEAAMPVAARRVASSDQLREWTKRKPLLVGLASAVALVGSAVFLAPIFTSARVAQSVMSVDAATVKGTPATTGPSAATVRQSLRPNHQQNGQTREPDCPSDPAVGPKNIRLLLRYAVLRARLHTTAEAADELSRTYDANPRQWAPLDSGIILDYDGRLCLSRALLQAAIASEDRGDAPAKGLALSQTAIDAVQPLAQSTSDWAVYRQLGWSRNLHWYLLTHTDRDSEAELEAPRVVEAWRRMLELSGGSAEAIGDWAAVITLRYAEWGNFSQWRGVPEQAVELAPKNGNAWAILGMARHRGGNSAGAVDALRKALELRSDQEAYVWPFLARAHAKLGAKSEASEARRRAVEWIDQHVDWLDKNPSHDVAIRRLLVATSKELGLPVDDLLTGAVERHPTDFSAWVERAGYSASVGQFDSAAGDLNEAILLKPHDTGLRLWLANIHAWSLGNQTEAVADCTRAIELDPKNADPWSLRCTFESNMAQWQTAIADVTRAIELRPQTIRYRAQRGRVYFLMGRYEEAVPDLEKAIEVGPPDADILLFYAEYLLRKATTAKPDQAARLIGDYRRICARALASFGKTTNPWETFFVARTCLLAPDAVPEFAHVVDLADRALKSAPSRAVLWQFLTNRALAHLRAGQFEKAIARANESLDSTSYLPGQVLNWLVLAIAEYRQGHVTKAKEWFAKADDWLIDQNRTFAEAWAAGHSPITKTELGWQWIPIQLLHCEAKALLAGKK